MPRTLSCFAKGVAPAMLKVACLVACDEVDDAAPEPARRVQRLRAALAQLRAPGLGGRGVHLARVGLADDAAEEGGDLGGLGARQLLDLQLQVLRQQLAQED